MSASIDGTAIDKVLQDAVDSGGVPHVAAIAADRDGVIYQGAAGPRAVGESDPVTVDTLFRIMSMTKMPCTVAALQQVEQGNLDLDAPVADYCPEFAEIQVLTGFDGDTPRLRPPARQATVKNLVTHTSGLGYWFLSDGLVQWEEVTGIPNVVAGSNASFTAPMLADPGDGVHVRHQHRLARQGRRGGHRRRPGRGDQGGHHRPARHGPDHVPDERRRSGRTRPRSTSRARTAPGSSIGEMLNQAPDYWAGGHGLYAAAERLHQVPAGAAARRRARRHADPAPVHGRRGLHQPDRRPGLPRRAADRRPRRDLRVQRRPRLQVGLRAAAQHRGLPRHAAGLVRRLGRAVQHPVLGGPHHRRLRRPSTATSCRS